jgi:hypothetical protein
MSDNSMSMVLFSESWGGMVSGETGTVQERHGTHPAQFLVVMACIEQELKGLLVTIDCCPSQ